MGWFSGRGRQSVRRAASGGKGNEKAESIEKHVEKLYKKLAHVAEAEDKLAISIDEEAYVNLLGKLIGEAEKLQNFPPELIPCEDLAVAHVVEVLQPYTVENGGPLTIETYDYSDNQGRSNVIIRYPCGIEGAPTVALVGSHLDVVPATAENWERNPFELVREGDKLYGRGTTDCLGHVALLTLFLEQLAIKKPELHANVVTVLIATEEAIDKPGQGVDGLKAAGHLEELKNGTCLWIDASNSEPCIGTAGALQWHLTATGKRFHSGFPHVTVNPVELVSDAVKEIQDRFYKDFPPHPEEKRYNFKVGSTMKPTQMASAKGGINQIPSSATVSGDVRLSPFYSCADAAAKLEEYVKELNETKFSGLPTRGPYSKYDVPELDVHGKLELKWAHSGSPELMSGIACDIDSAGFLAVADACKSVRGKIEPYSVNGSLPLVFEMQKAGFDLQIIGFGRTEAYHAENEFCLLSEMLDAAKILSAFVSKMDAHYAKESKAGAKEEAAVPAKTEAAEAPAAEAEAA